VDLGSIPEAEGARAITRSEADGQSIFNPLDHPICLQVPDRLTDVRAWHGHIPFAYVLVEMLAPRTIVELGVHKGDSYCAFCEAVSLLDRDARCYAVDSWEGDPHSGYYGEEVYQELKAYHDGRYGTFSRLIRSRFDEAVELFEDGSIDLLHIDGAHTYQAVKSDFATWLPKLSNRGVVLLHDTVVRERDFGVWRLWEELKNRYPNLHFSHSHGLGILGVGQELPYALRTLFQAGAKEQHNIQRIFERLGHAVAVTDATRDRLEADLRKALESREVEVNQARKINDALAAEIEQSRNQMHILSDEVEQARKAHGEYDRLNAELREALEGREAEINEARKTIDRLVGEIDQARGNIYVLADQVEAARKGHEERDRLEADLRQKLTARETEVDQARNSIRILTVEIEQARKAHLERDRLEGELRQTLEGREAEIHQARNTIDGLVGEINQARSNIDTLSDQVEAARKAHLERDRLETDLRQALRAQEENFRELAAQLQFLSNDLERIRSSWRHRLLHPLEAYRRGKV